MVIMPRKNLREIAKEVPITLQDTEDQSLDLQTLGERAEACEN
jgi:hypothetical protein